MCPNFERLHILLGERANVNPPQLGATGFPGQSEVYAHLREDYLDDDDDEEDVDEVEEAGSVVEDGDQLNDKADDGGYCLPLIHPPALFYRLPCFA